MPLEKKKKKKKQCFTLEIQNSYLRPVNNKNSFPGSWN